jgi:Dual specificity phosphatase, catalytic domain
MGLVWSSLQLSEWLSYFSSECQEVVPGLYIGNASSAQDSAMLQRLGITCVVDVSDGRCIPIDGLVYLRHQIPDSSDFEIRTILDSTNKFITEALSNKKKVLVHCQWGRSRSAAVVIGYLCHSRKIDFDQALALVRQKRPIVAPNKGFVRQLQSLPS